MKKRVLVFAILMALLIPFGVAKADPVNFLSNVNNYESTGTIINEEMPGDLDNYVAGKKSDFEQALTDAGVDKTKEGNIDYNTLFGEYDGGSGYTHQYAVVNNITSEYAMIEGNLTKIYTVNYDRFLLKTSTKGHIIRNSRVVDYTVVEGILTISGTDSYIKNYASAEKDNEGRYIENQYFEGDKDAPAVQAKIQEIKDDMDTVAASYYTTVSSKAAGYVDEYYFNAHDEFSSEGTCPTPLTNNVSGYPDCTLTITTVLEKFRVYKVTGSATTKNISTIDITLEKPVAGTTVNKIEDTSVVCLNPNGCYTQDNLPTVSTNETNVTLMALFVNAADFITDHYEYDMFEGEIGRDNDVRVYISLSTKNGYKIKNDAVITVNGEEPETVFPVIENNQVVGLVATIKPQVKTTRYTLEDDLGNTISFIEDEGIVFAFSTTDFNLLTDEELEAAGATREQLEELLNSIQEAVKDYGTLITAYQFQISDGNAGISQAQSKFKIRIKMTEEMKKYNKFYITYVDDQNNIETPIELTVNGDYLEGELNHLSGYALTGQIVEQETSPNTGDEITKFISLFAISVIGLSLVFITKKKFN